MEEPSPSSATSGDNFESFMADPLRSSPSLKVSGDGRTPSPVTRSASFNTKPSFISNFGQPWGLFHADDGAEAVKHPLMANHPLSDEDDEVEDSSKLPTASAASTTQTFSNSPEAVTSAAPRPVLNPSPLSYGNRSFQASSELPSLRKLARQGAWRALVDKVKGAKAQGSLTTPVEELNYATYHLLALMKLRSYGAAADELAAVGDLNSKQYRYEEYPSVYPDKSGSMVPFALRWMHAELPHRNGQTAATIERLYALLEFCNSRIESLQVNDSSLPLEPIVTNEDVDTAAGVEEVGTTVEEEDFGEFVASDTTVPGKLLLTWLRRKEVIVFALVGHHLFQKQYIVALQWMNQLLARSPTDTDLLSKVGYVQLQLGDLGGAHQTFSKVDTLLSGTIDEKLLNMAGRNRGLLHFAEKQYTKAFDEFTAVLSRSPYDMVSANNKALCLMYQRELLGATSVLEDSLQSSPRSTLNETMVLNLCSMYELASMNSLESKRNLSAWLVTHAPDDFDPSCTRL